jgi:Mg2+ and Co2+ transporter CorA
MNFASIPELRTPYAYPIAAAVTVGMTFVMWRWCKRRRWI